MRPLFFLSWLSFLASVAAPAAAQDTSELEGLLEQSVVSAASKSPEAASTAPALSISISADEIRQHGIRTVDEAINFLALGMQLEKAASAWEIGARGVLLSGDSRHPVVSQTSGLVTDVRVNTGDHVKKGAVVARVRSNGGAENDIISLFGGLVDSVLIEEGMLLRPGQRVAVA